METLINFAQLDLRAAFDLAIMIEEDAQLRYEEFSRLLADHPGGAATVFREMAVNEAKHRTELEARRRVLFQKDPRRIEISVMEGEERPDLSELDLPISARQALEVALAAEKRAYAFYKGALPYVKDVGVRKFFEELAEEEVEHQELLQKKIDALR
jgi:erythrin-vacuolar iron transport family protein